MRLRKLPAALLCAALLASWPASSAQGQPAILDSYYYPVDYGCADTYVMLAYTAYHGSGMREASDDLACLLQMAEEENAVFVLSEVLDPAQNEYFHHLYVWRDSRIYLLYEYVGGLFVNADNTRLRCTEKETGRSRTFRVVHENLVEADAGALPYTVPRMQSVFVYPLAVETLEGLNGTDIPVRLGGDQ